MRSLITSFVLSAASCASTRTTVISIQDIDCVSCSDGIVKELQPVPGVKKVTFNRQTAEFSVVHDADGVTPEALLAKAAEVGWPVALGGGQGRYAPQHEFSADADVKWVSRGERVELASLAVPGRVTVVDFGAAWCRPCRAADKALGAWLSDVPGLSVRKIDILDWDSDVAQQHLTDVKQLPYFVVYGKDGREVGRLDGFTESGLRGLIDRAVAGTP
jgi:thiol-disulfide isomerase/thioredoxin